MNEQRTARIAFGGDLDVYRRDEVWTALPPPESVDRLIVDLREGTLIDSTILSLLMRYRRRFIEAGKDPHDIVIVVNPQLRRVFEITGLMKSLTIVSAGPEVSSEIASSGTPAAEPMGEA